MVLSKTKGMVAYCGPGDTVTSFYSIVGEQVVFSQKRSQLSTLIIALFYQKIAYNQPLAAKLGLKYPRKLSVRCKHPAIPGLCMRTRIRTKEYTW